MFTNFLERNMLFDADGKSGGDSGGQDDGQLTDGDENQNQDGGDPETVKMTQYELNQKFAARAKQASAAEQKRILETLGIEKIEDAQTIIKAAKDAEEQNKTELEKAQGDLTKAQADNQTLQTENVKLKLQLEFEHKVSDMDLKFANTKSAEIAFQNLDPETIGDDYEGMEDAIKQLQEDLPNLFASEQQAVSSRTQTDGRKKGTNNTVVTTQEAIDAKRRAITPL